MLIDPPLNIDTAADAPIDLPIHDKLGRKEFALSLARRIYNKSDLQNGFVIGVEGPWGSGKTSVINLALHYLRHLQMNEDSPRELFHGDVARQSNLEHLDGIAPTFRKISARFDYPNYELSYMNSDHFNRHVATTLSDGEQYDSCELYRYFRLDLIHRRAPRNLVVHFSPWLIPSGAPLAAAFIADVAKSIGPLLGADLEKAFGDYAETIAKLLPVAGMIANLQSPGLGKAIQSGAEWLSKSTKTDKSLEGMKADLEKKLSKLNNTKIVIVIDDLDRLTAKEARQMISLVKGLGRLPNVLYVLGYDVQILSSHLERHVGEKGGQYLEKIVQTQYRLPLISGNALLELLNPFLAEGKVKRSANANERFREAWREYGRWLITTPRDVNRIGNAFATADDELSEFTDAADLFLIEIVSAKQPALYNFIRENLLTLCGRDPVFSSGEEKALQSLIEGSGFAKGSSEATALGLLFPAAAKALGMFSTGSAASARIDKRLHVFENSHSYFNMAPPIGALEASFLQRAFISEQPLNELMIVIQRSIDNARPSLRSEFLDAVQVHFRDKRMPQAWLEALIAASGQLLRMEDQAGEFLSFSNNYDRLMSILSRQISERPEEERAGVLISLLDVSEDYSLIFALARRVLPDINGSGSAKGIPMNGREAEFRTAFQMKLTSLLDPPAIWEQAQADKLLWYWWGATDGQAVKDFVTRSLRVDGAFHHIVNMVCTTINSTSGDWEYIPPSSNGLVDLDKLLRFAATEADDPASPRRADAIRLWLLPRMMRTAPLRTPPRDRAPT
ncbi:KAP family P-loop NTPase fold protein [Rhizobium leguminosarum]|uniref:KAP family P-loop NTPase fold protein n=1 Tax=Rhizobium leguminosarum TaxID=384 RepID=UPI00143F69A4|nr:P-loop NTPase fold protein [Rhizobium leguminosarum]NKL23673.1 hypothetical protein [Rhizobium leguminosarum bv. viciae]